VSDLLLEYMRRRGIEINRENYLQLATLGDESGAEMLDAELEAELPQELQHPDFKEESK
jgi:hypothetical protein